MKPRDTGQNQSSQGCSTNSVVSEYLLDGSLKKQTAIYPQNRDLAIHGLLKISLKYGHAQMVEAIIVKLSP